MFEVFSLVSLSEKIIPLIIASITSILTISTLSYFFFKKRRFNKKFRLAKSVGKVNPDDFGLSRDSFYHEFYLSRFEGNNKFSIEEKIAERVRNKDPTVVIGKPDSGKTRCTFEAIKKLPHEIIVLRPSPHPISMDDFDPPKRRWVFKKIHYLLYLDDAQLFSESLWIAEIIYRLKQQNPLSLLLTCRTGYEYDKLRKGTLIQDNTLSNLFTDENLIKIPDLTDEEGEKISRGVKRPIPEGFDSIRTPGIIVGNWSDFRDRYKRLTNDVAKTLLKANCLLFYSGLSYTNNKRINSALRVMKKPILSNIQIRELEETLENEDIIGWDNDGMWKSGGKILENIVDDYKKENINKNLYIELLRDFTESNDLDSIFQIGTTFAERKEYDVADFAFSQVLNIDPEFTPGWYNWSVSLSNHAISIKNENKVESIQLFREADEKAEKTIVYNPEICIFWLHSGEIKRALADCLKDTNPEQALTILNKANNCFKKAHQLKPDYAEIWNGWGDVFSTLAKVKQHIQPMNYEEIINLYQESFNCHENAIKLKPSSHRSWMHWGTSLLSLASFKSDLKSNYEEIVTLYYEALKKFRRAEENGFEDDKKEAWFKACGTLIILISYHHENNFGNELPGWAQNELNKEGLSVGVGGVQYGPTNQK